MNQTDIKKRLYKSAMLVGAGLSVLSVIGNLLTNFPNHINIKWIVLFIVTVTAYYLSDKEYTPQIMFAVFIFLVFIFLPFAFIDSGGSDNNAIGYIFLLLITVTFLFTGRKRQLLVLSLIAVFIVMHILEYNYPEIIPVYSENDQYFDRMIQMPLLLLVSFHIIYLFAKEYEKVNKKLNVLACFDELTGLYNRRKFNEAMEKAANANDKHNYLVLFDIDNFKKINDTYGHCKGDEVLKQLSELLKQKFDLNKYTVSRWGGDEFAVIYYGEQDELMNKLEDIKKSFKTCISVNSEKAGVSTSCVPFCDYDSIKKILIAADKRLYKEKHNKRTKE